MSQGRIGRAAATIAAVGAVLAALAVPAAAAPVAPPGWVDPGGGAWVAFTFGDTTLTRPSRATARWGPVTITRAQAAGLDLAAAFPATAPDPNAWEERPSPTVPGTTEYGWPNPWSLGAITLERVEWCDRSQDTCSYYATGGAGTDLFFAAGTPLDGTGSPDPAQLDVFDHHTTLGLGNPELNIVFSWDPSTARTPASGANPGRLRLDASESNDEAPGVLEFSWTVTPVGGTPLTATGAIAEFELDQDGVYCVAVMVTNTADGFSKTYGVDTPDCQLVDRVAPQTPGTTPGAGNGGGTGGGAGGGGVNVVFAPPRRSTSALSGPAGGDSVVWLWRPEFFQPGSETTQALPQTGRNPLEGRTDIVVATNPAPDSNAAPMLAGLGIFGVVGFGWLVSRWRRIQPEV